MARKLPRSGLFAALLAGGAFLLAAGARTLPTPDGSWIGILPPTWLIVAAPLAAIVVALTWQRASARWPALASWPAAAWSAVAIVALPWLPVPLPAACYAWLGPLAWLPWIAALAVGVAAVASARPAPDWLRERRRGGWIAGALAAAIFGAGYGAVRTILPGGDEPHYLVIAESLRRDGDLAIDDNHARGDYLAFFRGELRPDYLRRGVDRRIYSIHAPGLPALLLPVYAAAGYAGVVAALIALTAWGALIAWRLAFDACDAGAAWFAWAAAVLSAPILFHAFTVFADGVAGVCALLALQALVGVAGGSLHRGTPIAAALALALLPWLHTRAAVIAIVFGAAIVATALWRRARWTTVVTIVAIPAVSAMAWFGYFWRLYGTVDPAAPYGGYVQTAWAHVPAGLAGLLLDAQFGLLGVAPVFAVAVPGLAWMLAGRPVGAAARIAGATLLIAAVAYLAMSASYRMWWGGASAPARFVVPLLLPLTLPMAMAWRRMRGVAFRALAVAALIVTACITAVLVGVDDGRLAYGSRLAVAGWARWVSPAVDLARALPGVHRSSPGMATALGAVWLGGAALAWLALTAIERRAADGASRARALAGLVIGLAATVAIGVAWRVDAAGDPRLPGGAQQAALAAWQAMPGATPIEGRGLAIHRTTAAGARAHFVLAARATGDGADRRLELPALAPGRYRAVASPQAPALALRGGRSVLDWRRLEPAGAVEIEVPVTVPGVAAWPLDAAAAAGASGPRTLTLEWLGPAPSVTGRHDAARQVVRYGTHDVFFLDEESYPEAPGFWVRPGRSRIVLGGTVGPVALFVRNAPVVNRVELIAGEWRQTLELRPGEERRVEVPPAGPATALEVRASQGIRPFDGDPRNRDFRLLGVWIGLE